MDMVYGIIINKQGLISIVQDFSYELGSYTFFPNESGNAISFHDKETAREWVMTNIKHELIDPTCGVCKDALTRQKYLINTTKYQE